MTGALEYLLEYCGAERRIAIVREATKLHEEILRGTVAELLEIARKRGSWKGEFVIAVSPADGDSEESDQTDEMD